MDFESTVGVGSIQHILKTAFKNVYEEEQQIKDAILAKEAKRVLDAELAIRALELAAIEEAEAAEKAKLDKKGKRQSVSKPVPVATIVDIAPVGEIYKEYEIVLFTL